MTMTRTLPLAPRTPNAETRAAMEESRAMTKVRETRFMGTQALLTAFERTVKQ